MAVQAASFRVVEAGGTGRFPDPDQGRGGLRVLPVVVELLMIVPQQDVERLRSLGGLAVQSRKA